MQYSRENKVRMIKEHLEQHPGHAANAAKLGSVDQWSDEAIDAAFNTTKAIVDRINQIGASSQDIHFSAHNFHFTLTAYGAEWGWMAYDDADHSNELDDNGYFDSAAEAQQDALAYASRHKDDLREGEEYETRADLRRELSPRVL